jgi:hypothetical protein
MLVSIDQPLLFSDWASPGTSHTPIEGLDCFSESAPRQSDCRPDSMLTVRLMLCCLF